MKIKTVVIRIGNKQGYIYEKNLKPIIEYASGKVERGIYCLKVGNTYEFTNISPKTEEEFKSILFKCRQRGMKPFYNWEEHQTKKNTETENETTKLLDEIYKEA